MAGISRLQELPPAGEGTYFPTTSGLVWASRLTSREHEAAGYDGTHGIHGTSWDGADSAARVTCMYGTQYAVASPLVIHASHPTISFSRMVSWFSLITRM